MPVVYSDRLRRIRVSSGGGSCGWRYSDRVESFRGGRALIDMLRGLGHLVPRPKPNDAYCRGRFSVPRLRLGLTIFRASIADGMIEEISTKRTPPASSYRFHCQVLRPQPARRAMTRSERHPASSVSTVGTHWQVKLHVRPLGFFHGKVLKWGSC